MIRAYCGMPGSGKTNTLVDIAHRAIKEGRPVFSNIMIKGCYKMTFEDMINFRFPRDSVLLIDEAGRSFNARKWKDLPDEIFDLFTLHRHLGLEMHVAVQDFSYMDAQLRKVIELTWWSINYPWLPFYIQHGYYSLEKLGSMKRPDTKRIIWKSRKVRARYNHQSMSKVFAGKEEIVEEPWFNFEFKYKNRFKTMWQLLRIKVKRKIYERRYQQKLIDQINEGFENAAARNTNDV